MNDPVFVCADCGVNTADINEYYMLKSPVWYEAVNASPVVPFKVLMCIGCVENRIGRKLKPNDFANVRLNHPDIRVKSERLKDRLGNYIPSLKGDCGVWGWEEMAENNVIY
jgi:hypothetical protein